MPSNSRESLVGEVLQSKKGEYRITEELGSGGNGIVYEVKVEKAELEYLPETCAIKVFCPSSELSDSERKERFERFLNEIDITQRKEGVLNGIIPIWDYHIANDAFSNPTWYLMPKAKPYRFMYSSLEKRIDELITLCEIVQNLHRNGIDHRDIKPGNLLYYKGHLVLSDLGLCWDESSDYHITGSSEVMGPSAIRPPELERHRNPKEIDYKKTDVYLFAKTVWIVLAKNWNGFRGEYNRKDPQIYLDKKSIGVITLEPIHKMLEKATKNDFRYRISIEECLSYLQIQRAILNETVDSTILNQYLSEETLGVANTLDPDEKHFNTHKLVFQVLKRLSDFAFSVSIVDNGRTIHIGKFSSVEEINDANDFSIRLSTPFQKGMQTAFDGKSDRQL